VNANGTGNTTSTAQAPPTRPQMNVNQAVNPALQSTQTVNAAIEAARNQQMGGGRPAMQMNMPISQAQQAGNQNVPSNTAMGQPNVKVEAGLPAPINTAVTQVQRGSLGGQGVQTASPQSAVPRSAGIPQSAATQQGQGQGQVPQALSQTDALHQAARSYSNQTPSVMGHSHPNPSVPRDQNVITNKMPIPKHLPERAAAPPTPVTMSQSRPSYTGGSNNVGNGVMSQPVIGNPPGNGPMSGSQDTILQKNKLDELVRQVTGGGNGLEGGQGLAPDVEAVCVLPPSPTVCCSIFLVFVFGKDLPIYFFMNLLQLKYKKLWQLDLTLVTKLTTYSRFFKWPTTLLIKFFKQPAKMPRNVEARFWRFVISNSPSSVAIISAFLATPAMKSALSARYSLLPVGSPK
jgi:hypothetical protein